MHDIYGYVRQREDPTFLTIYELEPLFEENALVTPEIIRDRVVARAREHDEHHRVSSGGYLESIGERVCLMLVLAIREGRCERPLECIRELYPLANCDI